jgi:T-complex protein 1 subunit theta
VIVLAGQLLANAESLLAKGLHPSEIIAGYIKAGGKAQEILNGMNLSI